MAKEREVSRVEIRDWGGLVTHADRQDITPGSGRIQVNMQSDRQGALRVRRGLSLVQFDARGLVELSDIVSVQESVTAFLEFIFRTTSDSVSVTEGVNAAQGFNGLTADTVTVEESVNAAQEFNASVLDNANVSEAIESNLVIRFATTFDSVTLTESVSVLKTLLLNVGDTVTLSEAKSLAPSSQFDTIWVGFSTQKLYVQFGDFTSTLRTSITVSTPRGVSWDSTNTPWLKDNGNSAKFYLQSGQFSATVKTSYLETSSNAVNPAGISWDDTNTPWSTRNGVSTECKLMLQSGQFSSTIKTSRSVFSVDADVSGVSWDGTNTPWCGTSADKLYLQSGQFASTLKTSVSVSGVDTGVNGISWDNTNTLWVGTTGDKLYKTSGQFSSTIKTSLSVPDSPFDIETQAVSLRLS